MEPGCRLPWQYFPIFFPSLASFPRFPWLHSAWTLGFLACFFPIFPFLVRFSRLYLQSFVSLSPVALYPPVSLFRSSSGSLFPFPRAPSRPVPVARVFGTLHPFAVCAAASRRWALQSRIISALHDSKGFAVVAVVPVLRGTRLEIPFRFLSQSHTKALSLNHKW